MADSLQDLDGEVARLRQECSYFIEVLDQLERLADPRFWLSGQQHDEIARANHTYSWSAKENLERATDDLRNWWRAVDTAITQHETRLAF